MAEFIETLEQLLGRKMNTNDQLLFIYKSCPISVIYRL